nr:hypothetical protein Iba_chr10aCG16410 [Ipomoea batatas]
MNSRRDFPIVQSSFPLLLLSVLNLPPANDATPAPCLILAPTRSSPPSVTPAFVIFPLRSVILREAPRMEKARKVIGGAPWFPKVLSGKAYEQAVLDSECIIASGLRTFQTNLQQRALNHAVYVFLPQ